MEHTAAVLDFQALEAQFEKYVTSLRREWTAINRSKSRDVYEVMGKRDREGVDQLIKQWRRYIAPLAEAWWVERGYKVIWPANDSGPVRYQKL
jgi:hypothetical protein